MALSDITNRITKDAAATGKKILADAEKHIKELEEQHTLELKEKTQVFEAETKQLVLQQESQVLGSAERRRKQSAEDVKRKAIDSVFSEALQKLEELPSDSYEAFVTKLAENLPTSLDDAILYVSAKRKTETEHALKKSSRKVKVEVDDTKVNRGGFLVVGDTYEYNFTFDRLIEEKKAELEVSVAETLFS